MKFGKIDFKFNIFSTSSIYVFWSFLNKKNFRYDILKTIYAASIMELNTV